jgi:hypothetical protein
MTPRVTRRRLATSLLGLWVGASIPTARRAFASGVRGLDPAQVVPIDQINPEHRNSVVEVIRDHTIRRKGVTDSFPCNSQVYLRLLNEPAITLALWKDLSASPVVLRQLAPGRYEGTDGAGATASWEFVLRSPKLHVLLCNLDYVSPRGNAHLQGRIVLIVRSGFYREVNGEPYVQHDVEAFVKVDSKGWKTLARTVRPLLEKVLEDQVQEAGLFVSLMGRLVETYPNWACQVALTKSEASAEAKQEFRDVVVQNRRKGAFAGRPTMVNEPAPAQTPARRRS